MGQTISMIFDKCDVHYWLDSGKNSFLFKQEGNKGEGGEGGGGHWEKKEVDGGLVNCSKNKNCIADI